MTCKEFELSYKKEKYELRQKTLSGVSPSRLTGIILG
jgi:hypothetical protein